MSQKTLTSGQLRHRIAIDCPNNHQDDQTGEIVSGWLEIADKVPAEVVAVSGRDYIAAAQTDSIVTARITIRYRSSLNSSMRLRHGNTIYRIKAILPDPNSGREWLTLLVEVTE